MEISDDITSEIIRNCSSKKAVGCDQISMKLLKDHSKTLVPILTHLINLTIRTSTFPDSQTIAHVRPLHKKGDKAELNNYRPISILTATSKIIEKVLSFQLRYFLESNEMFCGSQFGFRERKSTTSAISKLLEELYENFNESRITQGIFLDFSKAFDTINHELVIAKLNAYGFDKNSLSVINSFLSDW